MKETPLPVQGWGVQAILGRTGSCVKTQTRRIIDLRVPGITKILPTFEDGKPSNVWMAYDEHGESSVARCRYGTAGDRLWVKETYCPLERCDWVGRKREENVNYRADATPAGESERKEMGYRWKSGMFMPRWASRIILDIVDVRPQKVQEITETDIRAEGCPDEFYLHPFDWWIPLWDSINGKRGYGWAVNPWVWAIGFRRLETANA